MVYDKYALCTVVKCYRKLKETQPKLKNYMQSSTDNHNDEIDLFSVVKRSQIQKVAQPNLKFKC